MLATSLPKETVLRDVLLKKADGQMLVMPSDITRVSIRSARYHPGPASMAPVPEIVSVPLL